MKRLLKSSAFILSLVVLLILSGCQEMLQTAADTILQQELTGSALGPTADLPLVTSEPETPDSKPVSSKKPVSTPTPSPDNKKETVEYGCDYSTPEEVALYIHLYNELPPNYVTKDEASEMGWGYGVDLYEVTGGLSIGGDYFGNYQKILPKKKGRTYHECDVNYYGGSRGAERLVYSNDGLIYYTADHYNTFTLLYGEE